MRLFILFIYFFLFYSHSHFGFPLVKVNDTLDGIFDADGADEEADEVMAQVLDEIGIEVSGQLGAVSASRGALPTRAAASADSADSDALMARLASLKLPS